MWLSIRNFIKIINGEKELKSNKKNYTNPERTGNWRSKFKVFLHDGTIEHEYGLKFVVRVFPYAIGEHDNLIHGETPHCQACRPEVGGVQFGFFCTELSRTKLYNKREAEFYPRPQSAYFDISDLLAELWLDPTDCLYSKAGKKLDTDAAKEEWRIYFEQCRVISEARKKKIEEAKLRKESKKAGGGV